MKRLPFAIALTLCISSSSFARADASNAAAAESLYDEGKRLETKGDFASACPKFAASQQLDPAAGTLLHLANCYEKTKKNASAWATYLDAASAAHAQNRADWEKAARGKAAALEPKLARVSIVVTEPAPGLVIKRDDIEVAAASYTVPIPVDQGSHKFTAEAPKKKPFTTNVDVSSDGVSVEVKIPKLEDVPQDPTPPPPQSATKDPATTAPTSVPATREDPGATRRTIGYVVGGVGIVGLGVGGVTGFMAMSANSDSKKLCPSAGACSSQAGVDDNNNAKTYGLVSTIGFIAGGALLAGGAVLVLTAPSSPEKKTAENPRFVAVAPSFGPGFQGVSLGGKF